MIGRLFRWNFLSRFYLMFLKSWCSVIICKGFKKLNLASLFIFVWRSERSEGE